MNPLIKKEIRLILPAWLAVLVLESSLPWPPMAVCGLGMKKAIIRGSGHRASRSALGTYILRIR
jgi:hypothetical protein